MAWRIHANPVVLAVGGVAAVILQLAEPAIRSAIWTHSTFRRAPLERMRHTAAAALITTFADTASASARIEAVGRMHARVRGATPDGAAYAADDPDLGDIVHLTAGFGFLAAWLRLVEPDLRAADQDRYWAEGAAVGRAFGAGDPPLSAGKAAERLAALESRLDPDPVIFEFLALTAGASPFGPIGAPLQRMVVDAAQALIPPGLRDRLGLAEHPARRELALATLSVLARRAPPPAIVRAARDRVRERLA
jgi:uncharacterized protein (DUF2236 family)